ncbi:hypothetical protein [Nonomuraea sp. 10N515B]|uniref:hypothetical protein n=1 Tax=Nonomuraea sp. 10N515B TaxID=3457422 RepID=UPI003FCD8272
MAAGSGFSMALHGDGTVSARGRNKSGQLGGGTNTTRSDSKHGSLKTFGKSGFMDSLSGCARLLPPFEEQR